MKQALLIGINYVNTPYKLNGCYNDIYGWSKYLGSSYQSTVMTDEPKYVGTANYPTAANIIQQLNKLILHANAGDTLFVAFSGHGGSLPDLSRDETDGRDECLYSCDLQPIVDDTLYSILQNLPANVSLRIVMDCCHSGSNLDLP